MAFRAGQYVGAGHVTEDEVKAIFRDTIAVGRGRGPVDLAGRRIAGEPVIDDRQQDRARRGRTAVVGGRARPRDGSGGLR